MIAPNCTEREYSGSTAGSIDIDYWIDFVDADPSTLPANPMELLLKALAGGAADETVPPTFWEVLWRATGGSSLMAGLRKKLDRTSPEGGL